MPDSWTRGRAMNARSVPPLAVGVRESRSDREGVAGKRHAAAAVADDDPQVGRASVGGGPDVVGEGVGLGLAAAGAVGGELAAGREPRDADGFAVIDEGARLGVEDGEWLGAVGGPRGAQGDG